ncbi:MAG: hypothetical protein U5L04_17010 [Trueperaceae bacterium]|nr:hypothetical protein [Trueperaceae bacterium]
MPSMVRAEQIGRNPHLRAAFGDAALRINPADAQERGLEPHTVVSFSVGGFTRHATIAVTDTVPAGLMLLPATPDQPVGLTEFDPATITVERVSLEMSA